MSLSSYHSVRFFYITSIFGIGMLESVSILLGNQDFKQYDSEKHPQKNSPERFQNPRFDGLYTYVALFMGLLCDTRHLLYAWRLFEVLYDYWIR